MSEPQPPFVLFGAEPGASDPSPVIEGATVIDTGKPVPDELRDAYYLWPDDSAAPCWHIAETVASTVPLPCMPHLA